VPSVTDTNGTGLSFVIPAKAYRHSGMPDHSERWNPQKKVSDLFF